MGRWEGVLGSGVVAARGAAMNSFPFCKTLFRERGYEEDTWTQQESRPVDVAGAVGESGTSRSISLSIASRKRRECRNFDERTCSWHLLQPNRRPRVAGSATVESDRENPLHQDYCFVSPRGAADVGARFCVVYMFFHYHGVDRDPTVWRAIKEPLRGARGQCVFEEKAPGEHEYNVVERA